MPRQRVLDAHYFICYCRFHFRFLKTKIRIMRSVGLTFRNVRLKGKYSFQYIKDAVFEDCNFDRISEIKKAMADLNILTLFQRALAVCRTVRLRCLGRIFHDAFGWADIPERAPERKIFFSVY